MLLSHCHVVHSGGEGTAEPGNAREAMIEKRKARGSMPCIERVRLRRCGNSSGALWDPQDLF